MRLVIEISKDVKETLDRIESLSIKQLGDLQVAVMHGTPLPKGHGRLIDADAYKEKVFKKFPCYSSDDINIRRLTELALKDAPTIIEADGGDAE